MVARLRRQEELLDRIGEVVFRDNTTEIPLAIIEAAIRF
jgi:hypothetical protein